MATNIPPISDTAPTNPTLIEEEEEEATPERLTSLITSANLQYSLKNYDVAAETYSLATELQATLNGEMTPANAELLYLYGRCLFKVAVLRSDVLGGQVAGETPKPKKTNGEAANGVGGGAAVKEESKNAPFFQVLDSDPEDDDEDEEGQGEGEAQEEEDDFATAYEILDLARVLYAKQMDDMEGGGATVESSDKGKGKATAESEVQSMSPELRHIKERLADTHDLQAEISLENERFEDAIEDSRSTLKLRQQLSPKESELIAEAHYKLALALEFTFFKAVREAKEQEGQNAPSTSGEVEPKMLYEAVENLVAAISSCEARIANEESKLAGLPVEEASIKKRDIKEVGEIVQEMMTRLADLKSTAKSLGPAGLDTVFSADVMAVLNRLSDAPAPSEALKELEGLVEPASGTMAPVVGESTVEREARIKEAASKATDLSGLVRHKKKEKVENGTNGSAKRKADDGDDTGSEGKKVKFDV